MRVLVACEFSGAVRDAFAARGHDAWSCDFLPSETGGNHIAGDVLAVLGGRKAISRGLYVHSEILPWDLMIAHPPCTHLAVSGARYFVAKRASGVQDEALEFVRRLMDAPIPRICVENPISIISTRIRRPDQIIQPWQFGHGETKATCLWLKGLKKLVPNDLVDGRENRVHRMGPGPDRAKNRSITYAGIATAMAAQWT